MSKPILKLGRDERGASAVEYALIASLIVLALIAGVRLLGGATGEAWNGVAQNMSTAVS